MDYLYVMEEIMRYLHKKLGYVADVWYSGVQIIAFEGKLLVLKANSQTRCSLLKGSAGMHIRSALEELFDLNVEIVILDDRCAKIPKKTTTAAILNAVCSRYAIDEPSLLDPDANNPVGIARQVAIYLLYRCTDSSAEDIGVLFKRDTSTVDYAVMKIDNALQEDWKLQQTITQIITMME